MKSDLRSSAIDGLGWAYGSTVARMALQLVSGMILARMLGPAPFGMVAAAWVLVGVASQFVDCGFGSALVQRPEVSDRDIRFAFTLQSIAGILLACVLAAGSGPLARVLGNPGMGRIIRLMSVVLVVQALGQTASSLLRRKLDFRTLQLAQLVATFLGFTAVALPMAKMGWGAESLVAAQLVQSLTMTVIVYAKARHPLKPLIELKAHSLMRFGLQVTATNLANWVIAGLDSLAMTRFYGPVSTGLFNRAQVTTLVPAGQLTQVLQSVLFPAYSRRTGNAVIVRQVYLASLASLCLVLMPIGATLAVSAPTWIAVLYGPAWAPAAPFLLPLALAMPVQGAMALNGPLLWAHNRVAAELRVQSVVVLLFAGTLGVAAFLDAPAISWCVLLVSLIRCLGMTRCTLSACGANWHELASALRGGSVLAVVAGAAAATMDSLAASLGAGTRLVLLLSVTIPATTAVLVKFSGSLLPAETADLLRSCCERLPLPRLVREFLQMPQARNAAWSDAI